MIERTVEEIEADIAIARAAITAVAQVGQSYTINSGGSVRTVTNANLAELKAWLADLRQEWRDLDGSGGMVIGANW